MDAAEQLYLAVVHIASSLRVLDEELGLSPARFNVLAMLRHEGPQRLGELARHEGVAQPTMTQLVSGLEAAGLAARTPDPTDGRGCLVTVTAEGRRLVRRARARKIARIRELTRGLSDAELRSLAAASRKLDDRTRRRGPQADGPSARRRGSTTRPTRPGCPGDDHP